VAATIRMAMWTTSAGLLAYDDCDRSRADASDPNHAPLADNLARLKAARTLDGKQFTLVELPLPRPVIFGASGSRQLCDFYMRMGRC